jgi:hypothetical protein
VCFDLDQDFVANLEHTRRASIEHPIVFGTCYTNGTKRVSYRRYLQKKFLNPTLGYGLIRLALNLRPKLHSSILVDGINYRHICDRVLTVVMI